MQTTVSESVVCPEVPSSLYPGEQEIVALLACQFPAVVFIVPKEGFERREVHVAPEKHRIDMRQQSTKL